METNYIQLCQSGKCNITYSDSSPYTNTPTPDNQFMSYSIDFKIIDSVPQKILDRKKQFLEKFSSALLACKVDNIVEDNNQELYYCHDSLGAVTRSFDSKKLVLMIRLEFMMQKLIP